MIPTSSSGVVANSPVTRTEIASIFRSVGLFWTIIEHIVARKWLQAPSIILKRYPVIPLIYPSQLDFLAGISILK
jgi:hypothetical protein